MISVEDQQKLLLNISRRLKKPVTAYAIGGTAMMFLGFKDTTLDIDIVFTSEKDKNIFKEAIKEIGYREMNNIKVYGTKNNKPEMLTLGDERFDLFVNKVIYFEFSDSMQNRAEATHQFNNNLILKVADPHDIILMKCATDRIKDIGDAKTILDNIAIDWKLIVEEAKKQVTLGQEGAFFELGCFLEKLKKDLKLKIPKNVLDELFEIIKKQAEEKQSD